MLCETIREERKKCVTKRKKKGLPNKLWVL